MSAHQSEGAPIVSVVLEPLRVDHADEMWLVLADPALYEFTGGEPPSREALVARYESQVSGSGVPAEQWRNWIVRRLDSDDAVGFVQATIVDGVADLAWLIGVAHQGQGSAVQAVQAMIRELESLGIARFTAHVHRDHRRSQGVAAAIGLARTGALDGDGEEIWSKPTA